MERAIRTYRNQDFRYLEKWFEQHAWSPWDKKAIPEGTAFIGLKEGVPVAFSCYFTTNSPIGLIGFTISDMFKSDNTIIDALVDWMIRDALKRDIKQLIYFTDENSTPIVKRLLEKGGILTESNNVVIPLDYKLSFECIRQC